MTEIVPTFSLWKREQKKLRAVSDTQPEDILVIKSKSFLWKFVQNEKYSTKSGDFLRFLFYLCRVIDDFACLELQH